MTSRGSARDVVERYLAALNRHDVDAAVDCVAPDFVNEHVAVLGTTLLGRDAYRERLPQFLSRFDDLHYEAEEFIVDSDRVAVPYTMTCTVHDDRGTHPVRLRGMFRFRVESGAIVHRVDYWDGTEFERQLDPERQT